MENRPNPPSTARVDAVRAADHAQREAFCRAFVSHGSAMRAYREAFTVDAAVKAHTVWAQCVAFLALGDVQERIRVLRQEADQSTLITAAEAIRHQLDIMQADPREIVWTSTHNCRHCWGIDGEYQWTDPDEYARELAVAFDARVKAGAAGEDMLLPLDAGGYGFTQHRPPNPDCEKCVGVGRVVTHLADLRSVDGKAAKLIKAVRTDRYGVVTVELHDQLKAADMVHRLIGAYKDTLGISTPKDSPLPADATPEQVRDAYLSLVGLSG